MTTKRKKSNSSQYLASLIVSIIESVVILLFRFIVFLYDLISFYTSLYKQKSGNNFFKTFFDKGNYGEFTLYRKIIRIFGKNSVLTNIYLDNKNTETTEIDVLAISNKGVYVFEMKNYAGYIYGSNTDQYWTQVLNKRTKNKFYNPLKQNYAHTKSLEKYLEINKELIVPLIVFSNRSRLSKISVDANQHVYQFRDMFKFIKKNEKISERWIENEQKEQFLIQLLEKCNMPTDVKQRHIDSIINFTSKS